MLGCGEEVRAASGAADVEAVRGGVRSDGVDCLANAVLRRADPEEGECRAGGGSRIGHQRVVAKPVDGDAALASGALLFRSPRRSTTGTYTQIVPAASLNGDITEMAAF